MALHGLPSQTLASTPRCSTMLGLRCVATLAPATSCWCAATTLRHDSVPVLMIVLVMVLVMVLVPVLWLAFVHRCCWWLCVVILVALRGDPAHHLVRRWGRPPRAST